MRARRLRARPSCGPRRESPRAPTTIRNRPSSSTAPTAPGPAPDRCARRPRSPEAHRLPRVCASHSFQSLLFLLPVLLAASAVAAPFLERGAEAVEAGFPQAPVAGEPLVELAQALRPPGVEPALALPSPRDQTP